MSLTSLPSCDWSPTLCSSAVWSSVLILQALLNSSVPTTRGDTFKQSSRRRVRGISSPRWWSAPGDLPRHSQSLKGTNAKLPASVLPGRARLPAAGIGVREPGAKCHDLASACAPLSEFQLNRLTSLHELGTRTSVCVYS